MKIVHITLFIVLFFLQAGCSTEVHKHDYQTNYYQLSTEKVLEEILDDAIFAITERNFRITGHLHIGKSIRERKDPDFPDYEVLLYCNLVYAKTMLEFDPDMVNLCPNRITIRQHNEKFIITASLWPTHMKNEKLKTHMQKMNALAREIVDYAADDWLLVYERESELRE